MGLDQSHMEAAGEKAECQTAIDRISEGVVEHVRSRFFRADGSFGLWCSGNAGEKQGYGNEQQYRNGQEHECACQTARGDERLYKRGKDANADTDARRDKAG